MTTSFNFPIFSAVVYGLLLVLVLSGRKVARRGEINKDFLSYDVMQSLKGFSAVCVLLHHISQNKAMEAAGELSVFSPIGFIFVGIFFFCSGYGLLYSLDTKENYLEGFFKRRVLPILLAYITMSLIYDLWKSFLPSGKDFTPVQWVLSAVGIVLANDQGWFPYVIIIMYLAFYFVFKNVKSRGKAFGIMFAVVAVQWALYLFLRHFAWWAGPKDWWKDFNVLFGPATPWWKKLLALPFEGEWWVNSTIMLPVGMVFAQYRENVIGWFQKNYWPKFALLLILTLGANILGIFCLNNIGYWGEFAETPDNSVLPRFITLMAQQIQVVLSVGFVFVLMMKYCFTNKVAKFFGTITLEFYLMQRIALNTLTIIVDEGGAIEAELLVNRLRLFAYGAAVFAGVLFLAIVFKYINEKDLEAINRPRNK